MDVKYKGMTVNERLYESGFIKKFYQAADVKDVETVIEILKKVEITDESAIEPILEQLGLEKKGSVSD